MEPMALSSSSDPLDVGSILRKITEIESSIHNVDSTSPDPPLDSGRLLNDCYLQLENKVNQVVSECSDFNFLGISDLDGYLENLKEELKLAEAASAKISNEIEVLNRNNMEDSCRLERELEELKCSLDLISSQDLENKKVGEGVDCISRGGDKSNLIQIMELENQIEENKGILQSLQDHDYAFKRLDELEQIEELLSGLKVIEFDGRCIRLALRTYIPRLEGMLGQQNIEVAAEPSEVDHELLIEVIDGTIEIENVEIFPNDVCIGDIIDGAKSSRQLFSQLALVETRSSLEWLVRKVQDRITQCNLRRLAVKNANNNRHSFEYLDKDEMIIAHMVGGIDACIKICQGWPMSNSPLKLASLKSSDYRTKEISLTFLSKVEETVNSFDPSTRTDLASFTDAIERVLTEQKQLEPSFSRAPLI